MKLLLAEDEVDLSAAIKQILEIGGYAVDAVFNGDDALYYAENGSYDGVILDVMMPGLDGITVVKKLREHGYGVPVLILTARAEIDDKVLGLDSGADDYLTKPFAAKELLARVRARKRCLRLRSAVSRSTPKLASFARRKGRRGLRTKNIGLWSTLSAIITRCCPPSAFSGKCGIARRKRNSAWYGCSYPRFGRN